MRKVLAIFFFIVLTVPHVSGYIFFAGCEVSAAFSYDRRTSCDCAKTINNNQAAAIPSPAKQKLNENNFHWKYLSDKNIHFSLFVSNNSALLNCYKQIKFSSPFLEPVFHPPLT